MHTHVPIAVSTAEANMQLTLSTACVQSTISSPLIPLHLPSRVQSWEDAVGTVWSLGTASCSGPRAAAPPGCYFPLALGWVSRAAVWVGKHLCASSAAVPALPKLYLRFARLEAGSACLKKAGSESWGWFQSHSQFAVVEEDVSKQSRHWLPSRLIHAAPALCVFEY